MARIAPTLSHNAGLPRLPSMKIGLKKIGLKPVCARLDMYGATDQAANVIALGGTVVLAAALLPPARHILKANVDSNQTEVKL
ncbi:MAG: hypothetical protein ACRDVE_16175 [Actinocrinis sp.]